MIDWRRRSYSQEQFVEAWNSSTYYTEVNEKLSLNKSGGSLRIIKETAKQLGLSFEKYNAQVTRTPRKFTLEEILVANSTYKSTTNLKERLFKERIKEERCERCGLNEWLGEKLLMTLDHIDGDNRNNLIENLRILCPNCHSQTPTWCGKNKVREYISRAIQYYCACGKEIEKNNAVCRECYNTERQATQEYPPSEVMIAGVEKMGMKPYADTLGISDNGLRKILRRRGIDPLPRKKH